MLECVIVERKTKDGKPYSCIEITLAGDYKKIVFLDRAEQALLKMGKQ